MRPSKLALVVVLLGVSQLVCVRALLRSRVPTVEKEPRGHDAARKPAEQQMDTGLRAGDLGTVSAKAPDPQTPSDESGWSTRLEALMGAYEWADNGTVGVYVHHLASGLKFSLRAKEPWYLASVIKVPVAVAVLEKTERGELSLGTRLRLQATDRVDGTGHTHRHAIDALLRVDYLLEQMLVYSDNTATDLLIREVGLSAINQRAKELSGYDARITTLADVRRRTYGYLHHRAAHLTFDDWVVLRQTVASNRVRRLGRLIGVAPTELASTNIDSAYNAFYEAGANSAPLETYGELLGCVAQGRALGSEATAHLLRLMSRIQTGKRRIVASLPAGTIFAHKTGTQHRRVCDMGVTLKSSSSMVPEVIIAACARDFPSVQAAERALREVGASVAASGVLNTSPHYPDATRRGDEPTNFNEQTGTSAEPALEPRPFLGDALRVASELGKHASGDPHP